MRCTFRSSDQQRRIGHIVHIDFGFLLMNSPGNAQVRSERVCLSNALLFCVRTRGAVRECSVQDGVGLSRVDGRHTGDMSRSLVVRSINQPVTQLRRSPHAASMSSRRCTPSSVRCVRPHSSLRVVTIATSYPILNVDSRALFSLCRRNCCFFACF